MYAANHGAIGTLYFLPRSNLFFLWRKCRDLIYSTLPLSFLSGFLLKAPHKIEGAG